MILWFSGVDLKGTHYLAQFGLILWYTGLGLEKHLDNLLDSDWFCYKQAGMLLEKYENLLELPVEQFVIQSNLASSIPVGQTMFGVWKTKFKCYLWQS